MSAFSEIVASGTGHIIRTLSMLLMFLQIYVLIGAFRSKRSVPFRVFAVLQTVLGLIYFSILLDSTFRDAYLPFERTYPYFVGLLFGSPWICAALILFVMTLVCACCLISSVVFRKTHIGRDAVKQTVDLLPEGICFGDREGTAVFFNIKMDEWCRALTGKPLKSAGLLRDHVEKSGEEQGGNRIVTAPDGTVLMFEFDDITVDGQDFVQITAFDVSQIYRITSELRKNNGRLIDIRERMREFSERAAQLAMSEELLEARFTVHDEVGHVLLRIKYFLDNPDRVDEKNLIAFVRTVNDLLISDTGQADGEYEDGRRTLSDSVSAAGQIGVGVEIRGAIPDDGLFCGILGRAIKECAINTVKHAHGSSVTVEIDDSPDRATARITNDGDPPEGEIRESGGLVSLRMMVSNAGGEMTVESSPVFCLTVSRRKLPE